MQSIWLNLTSCFFFLLKIIQILFFCNCSDLIFFFLQFIQVFCFLLYYFSFKLLKFKKHINTLSTLCHHHLLINVHICWTWINSVKNKNKISQNFCKIKLRNGKNKENDYFLTINTINTYYDFNFESIHILMFFLLSEIYHFKRCLLNTLFQFFKIFCHSYTVFNFQIKNIIFFLFLKDYF